VVNDPVTKQIGGGVNLLFTGSLVPGVKIGDGNLAIFQLSG